MTISRPVQQRLRPWVKAALVLYWIALFLGTHVPQPDLGDLPKHSDKFLHFAGYAGLSFLLGLFIALRSKRMRPRDYAMAFGIAAVYAVIDELLQLIPVLNRHGDVYDALADWCGAVLGLLALAVVLGIAKRRENSAW